MVSFRASIEGHQTTFGINYENHDNQKYLWHFKLTKKSNFNKTNNEEPENSTMAEFNLNAAIAPNLALGTNISREVTAEHNETQAMLNLRFVPHKNFYTEVGIIKKIGEENEGGIIEKENQTNIFLGAGYLKNGVNLGIRSHFTKNEIGNLTPSLEVSARYNLNLVSKIKG